VVFDRFRCGNSGAHRDLLSRRFIAWVASPACSQEIRWSSPHAAHGCARRVDGPVGVERPSGACRNPPMDEAAARQLLFAERRGGPREGRTHGRRRESAS
jgi:hypothetical protein